MWLHVVLADLYPSPTTCFLAVGGVPEEAVLLHEGEPPQPGRQLSLCRAEVENVLRPEAPPPTNEEASSLYEIGSLNKCHHYC